MNELYDIVYGNYGEEEQIEIYEDFEDARADFYHLSQNEDYEFIMLRKIIFDEDYEEIEIIEEI
jgi:hypothetical protein